jgi:hypothetical protein
MIYFGHFSFVTASTGAHEQEEVWHGYLTCVAQAESVELALAKFEALLRRLARTSRRHLYRRKVKSIFWISSTKWATRLIASGPFTMDRLFIDFRVPMQWSIEDPAAIQGNPRRVVIGDIGELAGGNIIENMQLSLAEGDDGYETGAAVLRLAFPKLHAAMEDDAGDEPAGRDESVAEAGFRRALHAELDRVLNASLRRAQLEENTDAISRLARAMDLPVQLARQFHEMAAGHKSGESQAQNIVQTRPPLGPTLFRISNHHTDICGQPPAVDGDEPAKYHRYFANRYGEQAVFIYDTDTHQASVRMGDAGLDNVQRCFWMKAE